MADINNFENNTTINGTAENDTIVNYGGTNVLIVATEGNNIVGNLKIDDTMTGSHVDIQTGAGTDTVSNAAASEVTMRTGDGNDIITNSVSEDRNGASNVFIDSGAGDDNIGNEGSTVTINTGDGNDSIQNYGSQVTISGGSGDDSINNYYGANITITAGDGDDTISNDNAHAENVTISGGEGNDRISNLGSNVSLNGEAGNDRISTGLPENSVVVGNELEDRNSFATNVTINGGAGNDTISLASAATGNVIQYALGDGNDTVYGFHSAATLSISGSAHTSVTSGNNIVITVGDGSITLIDAAGSNVNITGGETTPQPETTTGETAVNGNTSIVDNGTGTTIRGPIEYGGHTYYYITTSELPAVQGTGENYSASEKWAAAQTMCANLGGYLAVIDNEAENNALFNTLTNTFGLNDAYFGLTDEVTEGTWIDSKGNVAWVSGDLQWDTDEFGNYTGNFSYPNSQTYTYVNWANGEPFNAATEETGYHSENYATFYKNGGDRFANGEWNDGDFSGEADTFICEVDSVPTPAPTTDTSTTGETVINGTTTDTSTVDTSATDAAPVLGNAVYDIVFIVDTSGSMSNYIDRVNAIAEKFADILNARQIHDYRLAVVDYETEPFAYNLATDGSGGIFTTSTDANAIQTFKDAMSAAAEKTYSGGTENGLTAINHAINNFSFREGANVEFILLTDEDYDDGTDVDYVTATKENLKTHEIQLDVIGEKGYTCESEWTPMAQATGGNFYDITGDYTDTFNKIVGNLDQINVDLSTVPDGQTGYFQFNPGDPNLKGKNSTTAVFFATEQPGLEKAGEVTADKGYIAFNQNYRQNISIPDGWNVTATSKNDVLNVTGTGAGVVITSGEGHDAINLGESATGIILTDHDLTNDMLSFATRQTPGTFTESVELNSETNLNQVTLAAPTMTVVLQNFINSNENLLKYNVTNGQHSNTVDELLNGESEHKRGIYQIHFNEWHYSFTPPELANSDDLASDFGSPTLEEISTASFAVTATDFALTDPTEIAPLPTEIASLALSRES